MCDLCVRVLCLEGRASSAGRPRQRVSLYIYILQMYHEFAGNVTLFLVSWRTKLFFVKSVLLFGVAK